MRTLPTGLLFALLLLSLAGPARPHVTEPWAELARRDLRAIAQAIDETHPGAPEGRDAALRAWVAAGLEAGTAAAADATSHADWDRVLQTYVNGFRDGHVALEPVVAPLSLRWPGFLVGPDPAAGDARARVMVADAARQSLIGAQLIGCDGHDLEEWRTARLDPVFWNRDLPHERVATLSRLLLADPTDARVPRSCDLRFADGRTERIALAWQPIDREAAASQARLALGRVVPEPGLRRVGTALFLSWPSFHFDDEAASAARDALLARMRTEVAALRTAPLLVLDVRGNGGGNSAWGREVAAILWGETLVARAEAGLGGRVEWRVAPGTVSHLITLVDDLRSFGAPEATISHFAFVATELAAAQGRGDAFWREPEAPPPPAVMGPAPANPVTGRVVLLTDGACASACLDFADLVLALPGVTHAGLPTSADSVYMEIRPIPLPSGLARLWVPTKRWTDRARGHNVFYAPTLVWPGGTMTDEAVAAWLAAALE